MDTNSIIYTIGIKLDFKKKKSLNRRACGFNHEPRDSTISSGGSLKQAYLCAWTMKGKYFANSVLQLEAKPKVGTRMCLV